jgi:bifunctional NMN adenylyltransferase/nudix hydrolase
MSHAFDAAVCIGRFQLLHNAQLALLQQALALAPRCIVVIGSAHQARSPRNPFTCQERADVIRLALPAADRSRVEFVPVRDDYDQDRWVAAVRQGVGQALGPAAHGARVALIGHHKDATSAYLDDFPGWKLMDVGSQGDLHAKALRAALFAADDLEAALATIQNQVPAATVQFLRAWAQLPVLAEMRDEWRAIDAEQRKWAHSPYPPVFVTVDAVVRMADHVLLIRRGRAPGKGLLALPGGFIEPRETVYQSAARELQEETGFKLFDSDMRAALKAVRVFDHPDRSQRGRVITHAHYFAFGEARLPEVTGTDDAAEARWVPIAQLPSLEEQFHEDHYHILDAMLGPL